MELRHGKLRFGVHRCSCIGSPHVLQRFLIQHFFDGVIHRQVTLLDHAQVFDLSQCHVLVVQMAGTLLGSAEQHGQVSAKVDDDANS